MKTRQKADEQQTSVADSEEYKALKDQFDKAMKMLCDLKGIDNTVPNIWMTLRKDKSKTEIIKQVK